MNHPTPHRLTSTPFLRAIKKLLERQASLLPEEMTLKVYIAGGAAVQIWTLANTTIDLDCEFEGRFYPEEISIPFEDENGEEKAVYLDRNYSATLAIMHEDYQEDSIEVEQIGRLKVMVLQPLDLALSKITRWQTHDKQDVALLASRGLIASNDLKKRAHQALAGAIGNLAMFEINLAEELKGVRLD